MTPTTATDASTLASVAKSMELLSLFYYILAVIVTNFMAAILFLFIGTLKRCQALWFLKIRFFCLDKAEIFKVAVWKLLNGCALR